MMRIPFVVLLFVALVSMAPSVASAAPDIYTGIDLSADRLVDDQQGSSSGVWEGSWLEVGFTGASVAGLVHGYELYGESDWKTSAEAGGDFILAETKYGETDFKGFFGEGAYGLTRLSMVSSTPLSNTWRTAVAFYYEDVRTFWGTNTYIDTWSVKEDTSAVYDIAMHALAAYYVDATDKAIWRSRLIDELADVDDLDDAPTMALGAAVWALADTGDMDSTLVDSSAGTGTQWDGVMLSDLPGMLADQQVLSGDGEGSFYTNFLHALGAEYTETTAVGTLGLIAADADNPTLDYDDEIYAARLTLADGVDTNGEVYWKIGDDTEDSYYYLNGQTLQALPEPTSMCALALGAVVLLRKRRRRKTRDVI
jgi:hypothetical protein